MNHSEDNQELDQAKLVLAGGIAFHQTIIEEAIKNSPNKSAKIFVRHIGVAGELISYQIEFMQEVNENGGDVHRAAVVSAGKTVTDMVISSTIVGVASKALVASGLIAGAPVAATAIGIAAGAVAVSWAIDNVEVTDNKTIPELIGSLIGDFYDYQTGYFDCVAEHGNISFFDTNGEDEYHFVDDQLIVNSNIKQLPTVCDMMMHNRDLTTVTINEIKDDEKKYHVIEPDETIWGIAEQYGLSVADLIAANPWLKAENRVSSNQQFVLIYPAETLVVNSIESTTYNVRDGEMISEIADQFGVSKTDIINTNLWLEDRFSSDMEFVLIKHDEELLINTVGLDSLVTLFDNDQTRLIDFENEVAYQKVGDNDWEVGDYDEQIRNGNITIDPLSTSVKSLENLLAGDSDENSLRQAGVDGAALLGMQGKDKLIGGAGDDQLFGGEGDDTYLFTNSGFGSDIISDSDGGNVQFGATQLSGEATFGMFGYKLNGFNLRPKLVNEKVDLIIDNSSGDSITIKDWVNGDYGIELGGISDNSQLNSNEDQENLGIQFPEFNMPDYQFPEFQLPQYNLPELNFEEWASDHGRISWDGINWDGSFNLEQLSLDLNIPEGELFNLPNMDLGINMGNLDFGIDLSGVTNFVSNFIQEIIQGIINVVKNTIMSIINSHIFSVVVSFFVPIIGPGIAAIKFGEMIEKIKAFYDKVKKLYEDVEEVWNEIEEIKAKIEEKYKSIEDFLNPERDNDIIDLGGADAATTKDGMHHIDVGAGDDVVYGSNFRDRIIAGAGDDKVVAKGGDDTIDAGDGDNYIKSGSGDDEVTAGSGDDVIETNDGNDIVDAGDGENSVTTGAGNDTVTTGAGHDRIDTQEDNDLIWAGAGNDYVKAGANNDTVYGEAGSDRIQAEAGDDHIDGGAGDDYLYGGEGNDHVSGGTGSDEIYGQQGDDSIIGGAGHDRIDGGSGYDFIQGGEGADMIMGGSGSDQISGDQGDDDLFGGRGKDTIFGGSGSDYVMGGDGRDHLHGGDGDDELLGHNGSDILIGGAGHDTLTGGQGLDIFVMDDFRNWDTITDFNQSQDKIQLNASLSATVSMDTLVAAVNDNNYDQTSVKWNLHGSSENDWLFGNTNNDTFYGSEGADTIDGAKGSDTVDYSESNTAISINLMTSSATGGLASGDQIVNIEGIVGTQFNDVLVGDSKDNTFVGGEGDDQLTGGLGYDILDGGEGKDVFVIQSGSEGDVAIIRNFDLRSGETINLSALDQHISSFRDLEISYDQNGSAIIAIPNGQFVVVEYVGDGAIGPGHFSGNAQIYRGGIGSDELHGGFSDDIIQGHIGDDNLFGYHGNDIIDGGAGLDAITAGAGNDTISGGAGSDAFMMHANEINTAGELLIEHDVITDFDVSDKNEKIFLTGYHESATAIIAAATESEAGLTLNLSDGKTILLENVRKHDQLADQIVVGDGAVMAANRNKMIAKLEAQLKRQEQARETAEQAKQELAAAEAARVKAKEDAERLAEAAKKAEADAKAALEAEAEDAKKAEEAAKIAQEQAEAEFERIKELEAAEIQKAREAKIGLEFNIGTDGKIGSVDVKRVTKENPDEDQFIVAWNKVTDTYFYTYAQIFNQYSEALSPVSYLGNSKLVDNFEDVAIINMGDGEYKIGSVGLSKSINSGRLKHLYQGTDWQDINVEVGEDGFEYKIKVSNSSMPTLHDYYGVIYKNNLYKSTLDPHTVEGFENGLGVQFNSNKDSTDRSEESGYQEEGEKKQDLWTKTIKYYLNTTEYFETNSSEIDFNMVADNLMGKKELARWESSEKNYETKYERMEKEWNFGAHKETRYLDPTYENPEGISYSTIYNPTGFAYKEGIGVCYQKLQGDRVIELHVQTTNANGQENFDVKIKELVRDNIQSRNEVQFLAKAHELPDGRIVVAWIEANRNGISREIYAKVIDSAGRETSTFYVIQTDNGFGITDLSIEKIASTKFAITWTSIGGQDGDGMGTYGQSINIEGSGQNSSIELIGEGGLINTITEGDQENKGIQELGDNQAVFFWSDENSGLQARVLKKKGNVTEDSAQSKTSFSLKSLDQSTLDGSLTGDSLSESDSLYSSYSGTKDAGGIESYENVSAANIAAYEAIQRDLKNARDEKDRKLVDQAAKEQAFEDAKKRQSDAEALYEEGTRQADQRKLDLLAQASILSQWRSEKSFRGSHDNDVVVGEGGDDELIGLGGDDILLGGMGDDKLIADLGNDILYGGDGADHFVVSDSDSASEIVTTIMDFTTSETINLNTFDTITSFDEMEKTTVALSDDTYTMIQASANHQVLIKGITADQLDRSMFTGAGSNSAPVVVNPTEMVTVSEENSIIIDVTQYVSDQNGNALYVDQMFDGEHGQINAVNGQWVYTPNTDFYGVDTIRYRVKDSWGAVVSGELMVTVTGVNDAPTADIDSGWVGEDGWSYLAVTAWSSDVDGDAVTIDSFSQGENGMIEQVGQSLRYKPNKDFHGMDTFNYTLTDGHGGFVTKTVTMQVDPRVDEIQVSQKIRDLVMTNGKTAVLDVAKAMTDIENSASYDLRMSDGTDLPEWMTFNAVTKTIEVIEGMEAVAGKYDVELVASNEVSEVANKFKLMIANHTGSDAADEISGSDGDHDDVLYGGAGEDKMYGGEGADVMDGGEGDDHLYYEADSTYSDDIIAYNYYSGDILSLVDLNQCADVFRGGEGYDVIYLSHSSDALFLDDGLSDVAVSGERLVEIEEINCGGGDDLVDLTSLTMSYDDVVLNGETGDDVLWTGDGNDTLIGGDGDDDLQGGMGDDYHIGGNGTDTIKGYDGADTLIGGAGADELTGGAGSDVFTFEGLSDSTETTGIDTITDFSQGEDLIDLSALGYERLADIAVSTESGNTVITGINDEFKLQLEDELALQNSDFIWAI